MKCIILICLLISCSVFASVPCGRSGSIEERIQDCSLIETSTKGNYVLVTRTDELKEIYKDTKSGLVWGAIYDHDYPVGLNHYDAQSICSDRLAEVGGIKGSWRLPTEGEFLEADRNGLRSSFPRTNDSLWSSTLGDQSSEFAKIYSTLDGVTVHHWRRYGGEVRCVANRFPPPSALESAACGQSGSIEERIQDCSLIKNSIKGNYVLVARTKDFKEIYLDTVSGLVWGDRSPRRVRPSMAQSACNDQLAEVGGIKGSWRLPTDKEFIRASINGIRSNLPKINYDFWSSIMLPGSFYDTAWRFDGARGVGWYSHALGGFFRCVAHHLPTPPVLASAPCGLSGSVEERIQDCSLFENSIKGDYYLVTRTKDFKEIYLDTVSGLVWGDRLFDTMTYSDAEKACNDQLAEVGGIKGSWRIPSTDEFVRAEEHGIRSSIPNINYEFWASSLEHIPVVGAWHSDTRATFSGENGKISGTGHKWNGGSVRCVSRHLPK